MGINNCSIYLFITRQLNLKNYKIYFLQDYTSLFMLYVKDFYILVHLTIYNNLLEYPVFLFI